MTARIWCHLNRHVPRSDEARWDGLAYVGTCLHCARPIRRIRKGVWRRDRTALHP